MKGLVSHHIQGSLVPQRVSDGYVDATAMCKAAGKLYADYYRLSSTKSFLNELSTDMGIPISALIQTLKGGNNQNSQGTWVHPRVAIHLAQWLSSKFAVRVTSLIFDWMSGLPRHHTMQTILLPGPGSWEKRFPDEFYQQIYRLKKWPWAGMSKNRNQEVGRITNDIVWDRLEPGLREELDNRNPMQETGERCMKHHQHLADPYITKLIGHLTALLALMRASVDWSHFMDNVNRAFPKRGDTLPLGLAPL